MPSTVRLHRVLAAPPEAVFRAFVEPDAIAQWLPRPDSLWATRLQVIEADRLATPPLLASQDKIRGGVEIDQVLGGEPRLSLLRRPGLGDQLGLLAGLGDLAPNLASVSGRVGSNGKLTGGEFQVSGFQGHRFFQGFRRHQLPN